MTLLHAGLLLTTINRRVRTCLRRPLKPSYSLAWRIERGAACSQARRCTGQADLEGGSLGSGCYGGSTPYPDLISLSQQS